MVYKTLDLKKTQHIYFKEIKDKYRSNIEKDEVIKLTDDELKSIIAGIFAVLFHSPETKNLSDEKKDLFNDETNYFFNITKDFGRVLIENLDGFKLEWLNGLLHKEYKIKDILKNQDVRSFAEEGLIDLMNVREWEYGRFFLQKLFSILTDHLTWKLNEQGISSILKDNENHMSIMAKKIKLTNTNLESDEKFTLIFVLKEKILKDKMSMYDYTVISQIAQQKMCQFDIRKFTLLIAFNNYLSVDWNLNRGMGGRKL
jgi:hypothetical protein